MNNYFQITLNTVREAVREPIYAILLLTAVVLIGNLPFVTIFSFSDQIKMVVDSAMATTMFFGLLAAVLASNNAVSREMRNGTVLLLFSKPVTRVSFVLAKLSGIVLASLLFVLVCNAASIIAIYIAVDQFRVNMLLYGIAMGVLVVAAGAGLLMNYLRGSAFGSVTAFVLAIMMTAAAVIVMIFMEIPEDVTLSDLVLALSLLFGSVSIMATLSVVFATRLDMVANLCVSTLLFVLGLMANYLFLPADVDESATVPAVVATTPAKVAVVAEKMGGNKVDYAATASRFYEENAAKEIAVMPETLWGKVGYALLPNWQFFWLADALATRKTIPAGYLGWSALYMLLYMSLCAFYAVMLFEHKEIAASAR